MITSDNTNVVECDVCSEQILMDSQTGEYLSPPCAEYCPCKDSYDAARLDYDVADDYTEELYFDE